MSITSRAKISKRAIDHSKPMRGSDLAYISVPYEVRMGGPPPWVRRGSVWLMESTAALLTAHDEGLGGSTSESK